jgi:hypothetical protein
MLRVGSFKTRYVQLDQNSLGCEMRTRGNERVSVRQGYGYGCRYGTLNEANLLKTARTCCSLENDTGKQVLFKEFILSQNETKCSNMFIEYTN